MILDFNKHKEAHDDARFKAKELSEYILDKCNHSDAMTSYIEDPNFQKELVRTLTETQTIDV